MAEHNEAVLHDGSSIAFTVQGDGPAILLPVSLATHTPVEAETLRQWGADPDLGPNLIAGLARTNRVIAADYEAHRMATPAASTLTPGNIAADFLAIADAAAVDRFAYYGYSWLALSGLQLATPHRPAPGARHGRIPAGRGPVPEHAGGHPGSARFLCKGCRRTGRAGARTRAR